MSVLPPFSLRRPETIDEALETISFDDLPLGGGTELLLAMRMRMLRPDSLVAITRIPELQSIEIDGGDLVLGGAVTHHAASSSSLVRDHVPILAEVLEQVGNPRIRASGTLAGNLVFAEPKSDVIPILLALDARVVLVSTNASRTLTIDEFILGPYFCAREEDELLTQIRIPTERVNHAAYVKYQTMERPTVGVAALDLQTAEGRRTRVVIGAVGPLPYRFDFLPSQDIVGKVIAAEVEAIPDAAGSERYKRHVTGVCIDRAIARLAEQGGR